VTPQTPFIIGYVTKAFTALAVMQLVEAGKVQLDAAVQKYIPWFSVADSQAAAKIAVRQLLYRNSGLPMMREPQLWTEQDDKALERTVRLLRTAKMNSRPGQSFKYSNANYETLGLIVQIVSGQSYEEYVKQHIFIPSTCSIVLFRRNRLCCMAWQRGIAGGLEFLFLLTCRIIVPNFLPVILSPVPRTSPIS